MSEPPMPALAQTMSILWVGDVARACLKRESWEGKEVTFVVW